MPVSLFLIWERSCSQRTMMPVGRWKICTADSVRFTCWPPAPPERQGSIRRSSGRISTSTSSASGSTATVAAEVWMRP